MRGYNVLGAGFDIENNKYAAWNHWPNVDANVFPDITATVASSLKNLIAQGAEHPQMCKGVEVLGRFLEACEALKGRRCRVR